MSRHPLLLLALCTSLLFACEPSPGRSLTAPPAEAGPESITTTWDPPLHDGLVAPVTRVAIELPTALAPDALRPGRLFVVRGRLDPGDLAELARSKPRDDVAERIVPSLAWGAPTGAPTRVVVQPLAPLADGAIAVVLLRDKRPPIEVDGEVRDDGTPIATRLFPAAGVAAPLDAPWVYCLGAEAKVPWLPPRAMPLAPGDAPAEASMRFELPCVEVVPHAGGGTFAPPPRVEGFAALDPSPVIVRDDEASELETAPAPCADEEIPLGLACARVDDDRVVLAAGDAPAWVGGTIGTARVLAPLPPRARAVVRGLRPDAPFTLDLEVRGAIGAHHAVTARTRPARRHLVVNEALAHPPSGSPSQRFVELVNDGAAPIELAGLFVRDGASDIALPEATLPSGAYLLLLPDAYVDGLAGDDLPDSHALRLYVDELHLKDEIAVVDDDGVTVRSTMPVSGSTRTASRGRRTPERPDDAADAFGWDAIGRATPGRANRLAP